MAEKFTFPNAGIHIVSHKVGEADYFLTKLNETHSWEPEYNYLFSAFVSALRSITFTLQFVMKKYPGFEPWYTSRQEKLRKSELAKSFVEFRNHAQKTGLIPIMKERSFFEGVFYESDQFYVPTNSEIKKVPSGHVIELSKQCLTEVLSVVGECYRDFDVYIDPRVLFTERGITALNWTVEDIEEMVGFPRGYTDIPYDYESTGLSKDETRLNSLRRYGGDETLQFYLDKYLAQ
ncbi:hypothetical protein RT717_04115 [Imperialibacter roseus]|uniref:Uncharacterized protein n=1 Tax=Imperialibacter roseus TaxID=1324217 RepID=A0ABZ0IV37_9BACT|nr:hypothetical protein [Imperialibacter roseus]WOK07810.1 hypothetical protein RT717_04115 [Imperialibacter roseus]